MREHTGMTLPQDMTAIAIAAPGGPEVLTPVRQALPVPGPADVLIRVEQQAAYEVELKAGLVSSAVH